MPRLEHCNIRTFDLAATVGFYREVIGLDGGPYPGDPGRGAWLYDEAGIPVIHIIALDPDERDTALAEIGNRLGDLAGPVDLGAKGSGMIDHVAFRCADAEYDAIVGRIEAHGLPYRTTGIPSYNLRQLFVNDPSGVTLELNFLGGA